MYVEYMLIGVLTVLEPSLHLTTLADVLFVVGMVRLRFPIAERTYHTNFLNGCFSR